MITKIKKHEASENGKWLKVRLSKVRTKGMTMDVYVTSYYWYNGKRMYHKTEAFWDIEDSVKFYNKKVAELNARLFNN